MIVYTPLSCVKTYLLFIYQPSHLTTPITECTETQKTFSHGPEADVSMAATAAGKGRAATQTQEKATEQANRRPVKLWRSSADTPSPGTFS